MPASASSIDEAEEQAYLSVYSPVAATVRQVEGLWLPEVWSSAVTLHSAPMPVVVPPEQVAAKRPARSVALSSEAR